jgi:DNA-binding response OmpR family regulator
MSEVVRGGGVARVLICEDDRSVARLLALTFGLEGYEVETVADGVAGGQRLEGAPVDLAVLDVMLPGRDGLSLLRELRTRPGWEECRVIVLTALDGDAAVWRGWASGADYYLTKPFDLDHLREVAARLLADEPLESEQAAG